MPARNGVFIAYCFPEKKWLDRVHAAIKPVLGSETAVIWDERRLRGGGAWKAELADALASRKVAMLIVSDTFLESDFVTRAKLPALLEAERSTGLKICWVLASHCLFENAGLSELDAAHGINSALDGLGLEKREAELTEISRKVAWHLGTTGPLPTRPQATATPVLLSLDAAIQTRHESIRELARLTRGMFMAAAGIALLSLPSAAMGLTHFLLLAGFAAFISCQALLVRARVAFFGQELICMRYARSGLADETLPARQREPLEGRAAQFVG